MSSKERQKRHYDQTIRPRLAAARREKMENWARSVSFSDLEWIAGHFEGEGTVTILNGGRLGNFKPAVSLASTDKEVIDILNSRWPAYIVGPRRPTDNSRQVWTWRITGALRVHYFLMSIQPHIRTNRVRSKVSVVLNFCERLVSEEYNRESNKSWKAPLVKIIRDMNTRGCRPCIGPNLLPPPNGD
jgi:hypothetical protein